MLHCQGVSPLIHYLDDFLVFGSPQSNIAAVAKSRVETVFSQIGAPLAHHKTEGPVIVLTFLGITIDTEQLQLNLSPEKVSHLQEPLQEWKKRSTALERNSSRC